MLKYKVSFPDCAYGIVGIINYETSFEASDSEVLKDMSRKYQEAACKCSLLSDLLKENSKVKLDGHLNESLFLSVPNNPSKKLKVKLDALVSLGMIKLV